MDRRDAIGWYARWFGKPSLFRDETGRANIREGIPSRFKSCPRSHNQTGDNMKIRRHAFKRMINRFSDAFDVIREATDAKLIGTFRAYDEQRGTVSYLFNDKVFIYNVQRDTLITVYRK